MHSWLIGSHVLSVIDCWSVEDGHAVAIQSPIQEETKESALSRDVTAVAKITDKRLQVFVHA